MFYTYYIFEVPAIRKKVKRRFFTLVANIFDVTDNQCRPGDGCQIKKWDVLEDSGKKKVLWWW